MAYDGEGEELARTRPHWPKALVVPGLKVEDVFKRVRVQRSLESTNGETGRPWENSSSLRGGFLLRIEERRSPRLRNRRPLLPSIPNLTTPTTLELAARAYEAAERVDTVPGYQLVIEQFPGTFYADLAKEQLDKLKKDPAPPAPSPEELEAALQLKRGTRMQIQVGLWALGFNPGKPDGRFGSRTREAIRKWQTSRGYETTGHLDAGSKDALLAAAPDLSGPIWSTAQNQPCKVWNPGPEAGETLTWSGDCVDGKASGSGRLVWRGSYGKQVYEGEYRDGKEHGRGTFISDDNRYEGEFRNGKKNGQGTQTWASGQTYEGEWRNGKPHGEGTCINAEVENLTSDGVYRRRYRGGWREGKWHGLGVLTESNISTTENRYSVSHNRFEGDFREGKLHGKGTLSWGDASRDVDETTAWSRYEGDWHVHYEGEWRNGKAHGQWTDIDRDGSRVEGEWRNDKLHIDGIGGIDDILKLTGTNKANSIVLYAVLDTYFHGPPMVRHASYYGC